MPVYDEKVISCNKNITWNRNLVSILVKCSKSVRYFAWKYCKVIHPMKGLISLDRRPYQKEWFKTFDRYKRVYVTAKRQTGKTSSVAIYALHKAMFSDKPVNVVVCSHKVMAARDVLETIKTIYRELPDCLKVGVDTWNKSEVRFDNGSVIRVCSVDPCSFRGMSVSCLILDEAAYSDITEDFLRTVIPCFGEDGSIIAITSVPVDSKLHDNMEQYHKLFSGFVLYQTKE